jgi:hypothetical protein
MNKAFAGSFPLRGRADFAVRTLFRGPFHGCVDGNKTPL